MSRSKTTQVEFVKYFAHTVPSIYPNMRGGGSVVPVALGRERYKIPRPKARLELLWANVCIVPSGDDDPPQFQIRLSEEWAEPIDQIAQEDSFYDGIVMYGQVEAPLDLQVDFLLEQVEQSISDVTHDTRDQSFQRAYMLIQRCLRPFNELMDANRVAQADAWSLSHRCLHESYELDHFRGMSGLIEPTRRARLPDFVDSLLLRVSSDIWIPAIWLLHSSPISSPPDEEVQTLTRALLNKRRTTWANYLLDAVEYVLDAENGLAIISANIAIEVALKELLEEVLGSRGIKAKPNHVQRLLESAGFSGQLRVLLPLCSDDLAIPNEIIKACDDLRNARNNLLHAGRRSGDIAKVLKWIDAARDVCVQIETVMAERGRGPSLLRHAESSA